MNKAVKPRFPLPTGCVFCNYKAEYNEMGVNYVIYIYHASNAIFTQIIYILNAQIKSQ